MFPEDEGLEAEKEKYCKRLEPKDELEIMSDFCDPEKDEEYDEDEEEEEEFN